MVNTLFQLFADVAAQNLKFTLESPKVEEVEQPEAQAAQVEFDFKGLLFELVDAMPNVPSSTKFLIKTFITDAVVKELESSVKSFVGSALDALQANVNKQ